MYLNIAIVHNQIFCHEILESLAINNVELAIALETVNHGVNPLLELIPVLFVLLHLILGSRQVLIEFLEVVMVVDLLELILLSYLAQLAENLLAELTRLL